MFCIGSSSREASFSCCDLVNWLYSIRRAQIVLFVIIAISNFGCYSTRLNSHYHGPQIRPPQIEEYYDRSGSYSAYEERVLRSEKKYTLKEITLQTKFGPTVVHYFARKKKSDDLILVFPLLGGKNIIADYFADYFAERGFDAAIVKRNDDFKRPENFDHLEQLLRDTIIRDRIAMDFFENEYGKRDFGSFGISRGAMNVASTAGVDSRLKYNVMAMGATNIVEVFKNSNQKRIRRYAKTVSEQRGISEEEFYALLGNNIKTDPKYLAGYIDARDTLMFLSVFDGTVPIKFGYQLRDQIGDPKTIYLAANHYTSILYTQYVSLIPPASPIAIFPLDFVESESLEFYKRKFKSGHRDIRPALLEVLQAPFNLLVDIFRKPAKQISTPPFPIGKKSD